MRLAGCAEENSFGRSANKDPSWEIELVDSAAPAAEGSPVGPSQVIYPHEAGVACIRHVNLPGCVHEDAAREIELIDPAALSAESDPARPGQVIYPHEVMVV